METYEKHILTAEQMKPAPKDIPDVMKDFREGITPVETPPDERSRITIEEVQRAERIREREEARPIEETSPAAAAFTPVSET